MEKLIILLGHGSQAVCGNDSLPEMAKMVAELAELEVRHAYLQFCAPNLPDAVKKAVEDGAAEVVIIPYFLHMGNHVIKDIPDEIKALEEKFPKVKLRLTEHLGAHSKLAEIVLERISKYK
jgi:sirohydrochlorin ferrochelatase